VAQGVISGGELPEDFSTDDTGYHPASRTLLNYTNQYASASILWLELCQELLAAINYPDQRGTYIGHLDVNAIDSATLAELALPCLFIGLACMLHRNHTSIQGVVMLLYCSLLFDCPGRQKHVYVRQLRSSADIDIQ
jgi:hypothetical protein